MRYFLLLVMLVAACDRATGPRMFTLGPGCRHELDFYVDGRKVATLKVFYSDCTTHHVDSLRAVGWRVIWDTVWTK